VVEAHLGLVRAAGRGVERDRRDLGARLAVVGGLADVADLRDDRLLGRRGRKELVFLRVNTGADGAEDEDGDETLG
jgi:hypothetical protein